MIAVLPVRPGPNAELRYCLRSAHRVGVTDVIVIGAGLPAWVDPRAATVIPVDPPGPTKAARATAKLRHAIPLLSGPFLLLNDDMYATSVDVDVTRVWDRGRLTDHVDRQLTVSRTSAYTRVLAATLDWVTAASDPDCLSLETHTPLWVDDPAAFTAALDDCATATTQVAPRTLYGHHRRPRSTTTPDPKVYPGQEWAPPRDGCGWLSTSDRSFLGPAGRWLATAYPDPSPWERCHRGYRRSHSAHHPGSADNR